MHLDSTNVEQRLIIKSSEPKKFVFDLDGTIIYDGKPLTKDFERLLLEIKSAGHEVIFATGRSWRDFVPIMPKWCVKEASVLFGGGLVMVEEQIKHQHFLEPTILAEIIQILETNHAHYLVDGHASYYHPHKEHWLYQEIVALTGLQKSPDVDTVVVDGVYKILILEDKWLDYFVDYVKTKDLGLKYHLYDKCFDIMPSKVNKYSGFCELGPYNPNNVFIFGNDHNDLELMQEFPNSIMLGSHQELIPYAKIKIEYDDDLLINLTTVINTILKK